MGNTPGHAHRDSYVAATLHDDHEDVINALGIEVKNGKIEFQVTSRLSKKTKRKLKMQIKRARKNQNFKRVRMLRRRRKALRESYVLEN